MRPNLRSRWTAQGKIKKAMSHSYHANLAALYLAEAIRQRDLSRQTKSDGIRSMLRRGMRASARSWRRKWADI